MTEQIKTKAELLSAIEQNWTALQAALGHLNEAQLTTIHDKQGWSVKDHIIHLAYWARSALFFLQGKARHAGLDIDEAVYLADDENAINDAIFQKHKDQPLAEALAYLRTVHQQLVAALQPLNDDDLQKRYRTYLPDEPGDGDGPPAFNVVYGNSAHHFAEHLAWIETLAKQSGAESISNEQIQAFWRDFVQSDACPPGVKAAEVPPASPFGDHPAEGDELGQLVYDGLKTATCGSLWEYEYDGEALPQVGQLEIVVDGQDRPLCVIEITEVMIKPYNGVEADFAYDEGEDERTLDAWRRGHWRYFSRVLTRIGRTPEETMPLVCQRFRVLFKAKNG